MDYVLAKQLKDAGFPQAETLFFFNTDKQRIIRLFSNVKYDDQECASPSLEELIEACGQGRFQLECIEGNWLATKAKDDVIHFGEGLTPTEAVARLWLALNAK